MERKDVRITAILLLIMLLLGLSMWSNISERAGADLTKVTSPDITQLM